MDRLTIIRDSHSHGSYHIVTDGFPPQCASHLTFDEMLGYIARLMVPHNHDGSIPQNYGRPLFLERPQAVQDAEHRIDVTVI